MSEAISDNTVPSVRPSEDARSPPIQAQDVPPPSTDNEEDPLQFLQSPEQMELLNAIDQVRALGVGSEIPLPQLIVVGDQSSGKSSVLSAISGVKFPTNQGTCTRFATEVILRRSEEISFSVKIHPGMKKLQEHVQALEQFHAVGSKLDDAEKLIKQARDHMGLASGGFTSDVLRIHVSGPQCPHLTLVDLPGIIHNPGEGRTIEDKKLISDLVKNYMKQPRSIILAVVPAQSDYESQKIVRLAKVHDPDGKRTMGIITKPDRAKSGSLPQEEWLAYARGDRGEFRLGYHVVRNLDFDEKFDRDVAERDFFSHFPWSQLMPEKKGIKSLRSRLSKCLLELIRAEMPKVIEEIKAAKTSYDRALLKLGDPRETPDKQRKFITEIGVDYQRLVRKAALGDYNDDFFVPLDRLRRLRTMVRNRGSTFHKDMHEEGHMFDVCWEKSAGTLSSMPSFRESGLMEFIKMTIETNRGWELPGSYNPSVITPVFKKMSGKWVTMAQTYAADVWHLSKHFVEILLDYRCDADTCNKVLNEIIDDELEGRHGRVHSKIAELATQYTNGQAFTYNRRFEELKRSLDEELGISTANAGVHYASDIGTCEHVFVQAQAYYQVALDVFIDNVTMIAVENCLISGLEDMLSPTRLTEMSENKLAAIASESSDNIEKRVFMVKRQMDLASALETCKKHGKYATSRKREDQETTRSDLTGQPTVSTLFSGISLNDIDNQEQTPTQTAPGPPRVNGSSLEVPVTPSHSASSGSTSRSTTDRSTKSRSSSTSTVTSPPNSASHLSTSGSLNPLRWSSRRKHSDVTSLSPTPPSRAGDDLKPAGYPPEERGRRHRGTRHYVEEGKFHHRLGLIVFHH